MSYDLFFKRREGNFTSEEFKRYFAGNSRYEFDFPQAWYKNEDTGVYFLFEWQDSTEQEDGELSQYPVALNINYFRPSFFILEAEPEVTHFVRKFDLVVSDPQTQGMGEGDYNANKLISGWNHGNEFGYSSMLRDPQNHKNLVCIPTDKLEDSWRWNYEKEKIQAKFGESKFVPRIMYLILDNRPITAAVWPDGIPIVVPDVDYFIVPRKELAPKRFLKRKEDQTFVAFEDIKGIFEEHKERRSDTLWVLNYDSPPEKLRKFVENLPKLEPTVQGVAADSVLNKELVEKYAA